MSDIPYDAETPTDFSPPAPPENLSSTGIAAVQGESGEKSDWRDLGVVDVPVADLPMPDDVSGPEDFDHHITYSEAIEATKQLPAIQDEVKAGKTADDFWREDQATGADYQHGKQHVYDLYYGGDPVRLTKVGDTYDIESGRHRVYAAKELGLATIPAWVREKVEG